MEKEERENQISEMQRLIAATPDYKPGSWIPIVDCDTKEPLSIEQPSYGSRMFAYYELNIDDYANGEEHIISTNSDFGMTLNRIALNGGTEKGLSPLSEYKDIWELIRDTVDSFEIFYNEGLYEDDTPIHMDWKVVTK